MKPALISMFALCAATSSAFAGVVTIPGDACVDASAVAVHDSITNYDAYSGYPGHAYRIAGFGDPLLDMIESKTLSMNLTQDAGGKVTATDGHVNVVLQPINVSNSDLYPRLELRCHSAWKTPGIQFLHACTIDLTKPHYGLDDFRTILTVTQDEAPCGAGKAHLKYTIQMTGNADHVNAIKAEALKPAGLLAGLLGKLFNEDAFFKSYYTHFYNGWISTLSN